MTLIMVSSESQGNPKHVTKCKNNPPPFEMVEKRQHHRRTTSLPRIQECSQLTNGTIHRTSVDLGCIWY